YCRPRERPAATAPCRQEASEHRHLVTEDEPMGVRGEGTVVINGVTPDEVFDFVLDPAQYTRADTKMIWVTKLGDTPDGMVAREDGRFLNRFRAAVGTPTRWQ